MQYKNGNNLKGNQQSSQHNFASMGNGKRFKVVDAKTNREVRDAFVLMPANDSAARIALMTYSEATRNIKVSRYIRKLIDRIVRDKKQGDSSGHRGHSGNC